MPESLAVASNSVSARQHPDLWHVFDRVALVLFSVCDLAPENRHLRPPVSGLFLVRGICYHAPDRPGPFE